MILNVFFIIFLIILSLLAVEFISLFIIECKIFINLFITLQT